MAAGIRIVLLIAALWALRRELVDVAPRALLAHLGEYDRTRVLLGFACTLASFVVLGGIELIALRRVPAEQRAPGEVAVPPSAGMVTAFIANALSQSVGLSLLTGAGVRLRAYARYGLDTVSVARLTTFVTLTTTLGLLAASAGACLTNAAPIRGWGLSVPARPLGATLALPVIAYLCWGGLGRGTGLGRGAWRIGRPSLGLAVAQTSLSTLDWFFAGTVLFAFIPASLGIGYWPVIRSYIIAQTVGVTSHVPGSAGILEVVVLALLATGATAAARTAVVAALVMFRVVYYLVPLLAAIVVGGVAELRHTTRDTRALEGSIAG